MIITRSPLRITLGGGGTDLPSYYREHRGFVIAATIDKYVYVTVMRPFVPGIFLKYSKLEHVERVDEVPHALIREASVVGFIPSSPAAPSSPKTLPRVCSSARRMLSRS